MTQEKSRSPIGAIVAGMILLAAVGGGAWYLFGQQPTPVSQPLRVSVPPFVDTAFTAVGVEQGAFKGVDLQLVDTTWENQYELLAGGALDISMSTLDEFVNKDKNLRAAGKQVVYILPAWQFRGLGFYTRSDFKPLSAFSNADPAAAREAFLAQFADKKIVFPEGSVFDQAIRAFTTGTSVAYDDLPIVNASLDSALNSLNDPSVGIVAVGSQQRPEAERRGYIEAITPEALGLDVVTGFVVTKKLYDSRKDDVVAFACGWFATAKFVMQDPKAAFDFTNPYLVKRGSNSLTFEEYSALRGYNVLPTDPAASASLFLADNKPALWRGVWERSVQAMSDAGKADQSPPDAAGFVAADVNSMAQQRCP